MAPDSEPATTPLQQFYQYTSVLIVGVTEPTGPLLVRKLLEFCPQVHRIYLLTTGWEENGPSLQQHLDRILRFPETRETNESSVLGDPRSRVVMVRGDVNAPDLALCERERQLLREHVQIVFHVAMTVNTGQALKDNFLRIVGGTRNVLHLCTTMNNLKSVVHVNTAFSSFPPGAVGETFYDAPVCSAQAVDMATYLDANLLHFYTTYFQENIPDTNALLNIISEDAVKCVGYEYDLPVAIARLTAVVLPLEHRGLPNNPTQQEELTPSSAARLDMPINCIIAAAWGLTQIRHLKPPLHIPIYNCTTATSTNAVSPTVNLSSTTVFQHSLVGSTRDPKEIPESAETLHTVLMNLLLTLTTLVFDVVLWALLIKTRILVEYEKLKQSDYLQRFTDSSSSTSKTKNVNQLWKMLPNRDKRLLNFDLVALDLRIKSQLDKTG